MYNENVIIALVIHQIKAMYCVNASQLNAP